MATRTKFTSPEDEVEQVQNKFGDLIGIYNAALSLSETQKELVLVQSIKSWKELVSRLEDMELSKREMALHKGSTVYGDDNGQPYPKIVFLLTHSYSHLSEVHARLGHFQKAIDFCNKAIAYGENLGDKVWLATVYSFLARRYWQLNEDASNNFKYKTISFGIFRDAARKAKPEEKPEIYLELAIELDFLALHIDEIKDKFASIDHSFIEEQLKTFFAFALDNYEHLEGPDTCIEDFEKKTKKFSAFIRETHKNPDRLLIFLQVSALINYSLWLEDFLLKIKTKYLNKNGGQDIPPEEVAWIFDYSFSPEDSKPTLSMPLENLKQIGFNNADIDRIKEKVKSDRISKGDLEFIDATPDEKAEISSEIDQVPLTSYEKREFRDELRKIKLPNKERRAIRFLSNLAERLKGSKEQVVKYYSVGIYDYIEATGSRIQNLKRIRRI